MKTLARLSYFLFLGLVSSRAEADGIKIVAAENFYGGLAKQIGGGVVEVTSILSNPNQDPHEFTTSADTAKAVADADIVIYNGLSYDPWMDKLLATRGKSGRVVIKVADLIDAKDGANPHIWYNPKTMPALAAKLVDLLEKSNLKEDARKDLRMRFLAFEIDMQTETDRIKVISASSTGVVVTATEPVFGYMAKALGLKMLNDDFQVAIMNDAEPTAAQTIAFEQSLRSRKAKILFYNRQVTDPTTARLQEIAKKAGVPIVGVTETQPPDRKTYVDWMLHELDDVQAALGAKSP